MKNYRAGVVIISTNLSLGNGRGILHANRDFGMLDGEC